MNDAHVKALHYAVTHSDRVNYDKAESLEHEEPGFRIKVENGRAQIEMKDHHPTADSARAAAEPFLRNWEFLAELRFGPDELAFRYESADIIERNPARGNHAVYAEPGAYRLTGSDVEMRIGRSRYPPAPSGIERDADVDLMFMSYKCIVRAAGRYAMRPISA